MEVSDIEKMNYSEFVGLTKERNRPSGGIKTIHKVAVNALLDSNKTMLEIGCNTGFTSVNMALLTGCKCVGIDINQDSLEEAARYANQEEIEEKVSFLKCDAEKLPFKDNFFDVVWCSNVTSFIKNKEKVIREYFRVLKNGGTLVAIPIYYIANPPKKIVEEVSRVIGTEIGIWDKSFWIEKFDKSCEGTGSFIELYYEKDYLYKDVGDKIQDYVEMICNKPHLRSLPPDVRKEVRNKSNFFMSLFNENLKYAGFSILLFNKRNYKEEKELFISKEI